MKPIAYACGLLDELDGALRTDDKQLAAGVRDELARVADAVRAEAKSLDIDTVEDTVRADAHQILRRLEDAMSAGKKRTTVKPGAPETTALAG